MNDSYIDKILEEKKSLTPKTGFNVVLFDDYSPVGEKLTLVAHTESEEEAQKIAKKEGSDDRPAFIYGGDKNRKKKN